MRAFPPTLRSFGLLVSLAIVACGAPLAGASPDVADVPDASSTGTGTGTGADAGDGPEAGADGRADGGRADDGGAGAEAGGDAGSPDLGPGGDFRAYAAAVATRLQGFYDASTGLFPSTGWWNSANAITALAEYARVTGTTSFTTELASTFDKNKSKSFLNDYYDDEGWWALAWIKVFDLTHDARYLDMAKTIFADMTGGWDAATCKGGIWWSKAKTYKNAIANELFLEVAVRLHQRTPTDGAGPGSFLDWAKREWAWFDASGMINASSLVNDGLDASCKNNGQATWSYNQGVIAGGLVELAAVTGDATLLVRATGIAHAAMKKLGGAGGVLGEPCGATCSGPDVPQFKGIFMRHLGALQAATGDAAARAFLATNADWIWNAAKDAGDQVGLQWTGPFDSADGARQSAALDALVAAIPFAAPQTNALLHKTATANGACAADQGPEKAFDGTDATKWCAGATAGAYWLALDTGAATTMSRVVVRHAGAGGEKQAWNTRDFVIEVSPDGSAWSTVATVTGNTLPVTIHRFAAAQARHARLTITSPQTDPATVAARIYEVEAYAR
jgi:predicted alpha-1,6-mannanase (GH76 family)